MRLSLLAVCAANLHTQLAWALQPGRSRTLSGLSPRRVQCEASKASDVDLTSDQFLNTHVFCNVELNGNNLETVGFDMDFTLAQYNEEYVHRVFPAMAYLTMLD